MNNSDPIAVKAVPVTERETQTTDFAIAVILPTYNRPDVLIACLEHLERQTFPDFEVIVVDDGSTDATPQLLQEFQLRTRLHLRYIFQGNSGPARARNVAISRVNAPICLIIGDDILASSDLVKTHLELHQERPEIQVAGLGLTRWTESGQQITKFMRWLEDDDIQFAYGKLLHGDRPDWKHFYTSNLSVKTELLRRFPFNESFPKAAMEDIELGYRIEKQHGLELVFLPHAVAGHRHPTRFLDSCRRASGVGLSTRLFHELWPDQLPAPSSAMRRAVRAIFLSNPWLISLFTSFADVLTRFWCPNPFMLYALSLHSAVGYRNKTSSPPRGTEGQRST